MKLLLVAATCLASASTALVVVSTECVTLQLSGPPTIYGPFNPSYCSSICKDSLVYIAPFPVNPADSGGTRVFACVCGPQANVKPEKSSFCNTSAGAGGITDRFYWSFYRFDSIVTRSLALSFPSTSNIGGGVGPPLRPGPPKTIESSQVSTRFPAPVIPGSGSTVQPPGPTSILVAVSNTAVGDIITRTLNGNNISGEPLSGSTSVVGGGGGGEGGGVGGGGGANPGLLPPQSSPTQTGSSKDNFPSSPTPPPTISPLLIAILSGAAIVVLIGLFTISRFRKRLSRSSDEMNSSPLQNRYLEDNGEDPVTAQFSLHVEEEEEEEEEEGRRRQNQESLMPALNSIPSSSESTRSTTRTNPFASPAVIIAPVSVPESSARPLAGTGVRRSRELLQDKTATNNSPTGFTPTNRILGASGRLRDGRGRK
ncbi:hypothetical protein BDR26DRAFT_860173 [Obelidium mucronatum]|nr:hypothetical protein BDR26DRAFT_860173 [Obelidium mucronatum]